jgi:hypothetical protein
VTRHLALRRRASGHFMHSRVMPTGSKAPIIDTGWSGTFENRVAIEGQLHMLYACIIPNRPASSARELTQVGEGAPS